MTAEVRNPAKLPTELYPAEDKFVRDLAEGKPCTIGDGKLPKKAMESGVGANVVRSEVIRFFAFGGNKKLDSVIRLRGAWIAGGLNFTHASIPYTLMFSNCHFNDFVTMEHTECTALSMKGSRLAQGLLLDNLTTKGDVNLSEGFFAEGGVRLMSASIGRNLNCVGGKFHNLGESRYALIAYRLKTQGGVYLHGGFSAEGGVLLLNANIGEDLDCMDGNFHNPGESALVADDLTTKGNVNLGNNFSAEGEVQLLNVNIGGDLDCAGGNFHNPGESALVADGLTTKGNVNFRNGFSVEGAVKLSKMSISGYLDCTNGKFHNPDGDALNIEKGNISGSLFWRETTCTGDVNLAYAKADMLVDDPDSWKSCKVNLDGFIYGQFANPAGAQFRTDWLSKRPDKIPFAPQPYEQAAKALFGIGRASDARKILLEKERESTMHGQWWHRPLRWLWDICAGYGYDLWRTTFWSVIFILIGTGVFWYANHHCRIVPAQVIVQADSYYEHVVKSHGVRPTDVVPKLFPGYVEFTPLAYSLDVFIPFFILQQESTWFPASGGPDNVWKPSIMLLFAFFALVIFAFLGELIQRQCEKWCAKWLGRVYPLACVCGGVLGALVIIVVICFFLSNWLFSDWLAFLTGGG